MSESEEKSGSLSVLFSERECLRIDTWSLEYSTTRLGIGYGNAVSIDGSKKASRIDNSYGMRVKSAHVGIRYHITLTILAYKCIEQCCILPV